MRVLVAGDVHGKVWHLDYLYREAVRVGADLVFAVGDFAAWNNDVFVRYLNVLTEVHGIPCWWLDGNHDDHGWLHDSGAATADRPTPVWASAPDVYYLPRGCTWTWGTTRCAALGGATSVDRSIRTPYRDWWPQEEISQGDVYRILDNVDRVDVLFTHEAPVGTEPLERQMTHSEGQVWYDSKRQREAVAAVVDALRPRLLIHGHHHRRYDGIYRRTDGGTTRVQGLSCHGTRRASWTILDIQD